MNRVIVVVTVWLVGCAQDVGGPSGLVEADAFVPGFGADTHDVAVRTPADVPPETPIDAGTDQWSPPPPEDVVSPDVADAQPDAGPPDLPDPPDPPECGDGIVQAELNEQCDDGNTKSGDGCRDDCVIEEPIGAGFTGGQCQADAECAPAGSLCIDGVGGGSCAVACEVYCDDQAGSPTTFCISAAVYESRMDAPLPAGLAPAMCVSKCDYLLFPRTGCRAGLHCEQRKRHQTSVRDEVCVPGPWSIGLALSGDGKVLGLEASEPEPAEPYSRLLTASCSGSFEPVDAGLFEGLSGTLMAMGGPGHDEDWQRLCSASGLPSKHNIGTEAAAGRAFRLPGSRLEVVDWTAAGIYGSKGAAGVLVGGPLFGSRAMVYRQGGSVYLYADGADDFPYADPERGRHFGMISGKEWGPLDAEIVPSKEFVTIKADGGARFYRQWARLATVQYIAEQALDHLANHDLPLGVGDFSLPTGGDIDGHGSHETGLDVDIYLLGFDLGSLQLWVASCDSGGGWKCWYHDDKTGEPEDLSDPEHVPAASMLTTLAQFAYDFPGPSHFVQHDVPVLSLFAALPGNKPKYVDASNAAAQGWPPHKNHVHIRFLK